MYFKNTVIKLNFTESGGIQFFKYDDCMNLSESQYVPYFGIIPTHNYNRLMYFRKDNKKYTPKNAIIIPFPSSKKVFLNEKDTIT